MPVNILQLTHWAFKNFQIFCFIVLYFAGNDLKSSVALISLLLILGLTY